MKMKNKGFTAVELVIVIAVIAVLAAVLIPTFTSIVNNSRKSQAMQEANEAFKIAYNAVLTEDMGIEEGAGMAVNLFEFIFENNGKKVSISTQVGNPYHDKYTFEYVDGAIVVNDK